MLHRWYIGIPCESLFQPSRKKGTVVITKSYSVGMASEQVGWTVAYVTAAVLFLMLLCPIANGFSYRSSLPSSATAAQVTRMMIQDELQVPPRMRVPLHSHDHNHSHAHPSHVHSPVHTPPQSSTHIHYPHHTSSSQIHLMSQPPVHHHAARL